MKLAQFKESLKKADQNQLFEMLVEFRKQLFTVRINSATSHVKDYSQFQKLRRGVARVMTELSIRAMNDVSTLKVQGR